MKKLLPLLLVPVALVGIAATYTITQLTANNNPGNSTVIEVYDPAATPKSGKVLLTNYVKQAQIDTSAEIQAILGNVYQGTNAHLTDLADGTLTGSKVGTGINGDNVTSGTVADARIAATLARDSEVAAAYQPLDADLTSWGAITPNDKQNADSDLNWLAAGLDGIVIGSGNGSGYFDMYDGDGVLHGTSAGVLVWTNTLVLDSVTATNNITASNFVVSTSITLSDGTGSDGEVIKKVGGVLTWAADETAAGGEASGTVHAPDGATTANRIAVFKDTSGTNITQAAVTVADLAPLANPTFTGNPAAPTPAENDNDTSIATTAYVQTEIAGLGGGAWGTITGTLANQTDLGTALSARRLFREAPLNLSGTAIDLSLTNRVFSKNLSGNTVLTFSNPTAGDFFSLIITNGGSHTLTLPTTTWLSGSAPVLDTGAGTINVFYFYYTGDKYLGDVGNKSSTVLDAIAALANAAGALVNDGAGNFSYVTKQNSDTDLDDLADGSLTGSKVGTGISGDNITTGTVADAQIASTIARDSEVAATYAPLASPALTGTPTAPTAAANDNDTSIATTAYVQTELGDIDDDNVSFDDADGLWTASKIGPALEEMNDSINAGAPNGTGAKVHWSQLLGVPAGFSDGTDDGGAGTGSTNITDNAYVAQIRNATILTNQTVNGQSGFAGFTAANLPTGVGAGYQTYCTDCYTPKGTGSLVVWDGSNWLLHGLSSERSFKATASLPQYMLNALSAGWSGDSIYSSARMADVWAGTAVGQMDGSFIYLASGSGSQSHTASAGRSYVNLTTATSATANSAIYSTWWTPTAGDIYQFGCEATLSFLSDDTEKYAVTIGVTQSVPDVGTAGAFFLYDRSNALGHLGTGYNTNNWWAVTRMSSANTTNDTGVAVAATPTWTKFAVQVTPTYAAYWINGTLVASNNVSLSGNLLLGRMTIIKSAGTTQRNLSVDWLNSHIRYNTARSFF